MGEDILRLGPESLRAWGYCLQCVVWGQDRVTPPLTTGNKRCSKYWGQGGHFFTQRPSKLISKQTYTQLKYKHSMTSGKPAYWEGHATSAGTPARGSGLERRVTVKGALQRQEIKTRGSPASFHLSLLPRQKGRSALPCVGVILGMA